MLQQLQLVRGKNVEQFRRSIGNAPAVVAPASTGAYSTRNQEASQVAAAVASASGTSSDVLPTDLLTSEVETSHAVVTQQAPVPSSTAIVDPNAAHYVFPLNAPNKSTLSLPPIVTSTKTTSAKLVKLKGELFNILYAFPEKALKWPHLDEESEISVTRAGEEAAQALIEAHQSLPTPPNEADLARAAEKASRKAKRRLRRKLAIEKFGVSVQTAITPQELMQQVLILESAVPITLTFKHTKEALPQSAVTVADVAQRIFVLDRSIAYDAIVNVENATLFCPFRLRTQFAPRCHAHGFCIRYMGHMGKCSTGANHTSRLPDQFLLAPPTDPFSSQRGGVVNNAYKEYSTAAAGLNAPGANGGIVNAAMRSAYGRETNGRPSTSSSSLYNAAPRPEMLPRLAALAEKLLPDIEKEQGYLPMNNEITASLWI